MVFFILFFRVFHVFCTNFYWELYFCTFCKDEKVLGKGRFLWNLHLTDRFCKTIKKYTSIKIYENTLHYEICSRQKNSSTTRIFTKKINSYIWRQQIHSKQIMLVNMTILAKLYSFSVPPLRVSHLNEKLSFYKILSSVLI